MRVRQQEAQDEVACPIADYDEQQLPPNIERDITLFTDKSLNRPQAGTYLEAAPGRYSLIPCLEELHHAQFCAIEKIPCLGELHHAQFLTLW